MTKTTPIFVTGSDYGGKGYVYDMLKRHPLVFIRDKEWYWAGYRPTLAKQFPNLEEPDVLRDLVIFHLTEIHQENQQNYPSVFAGTADAFASAHADAVLASLCNDPHQDTVFAAVMGHVARLCGKTWYMQLATGQYIQRLANNLPDAKFLAVIRDPRNMLVSRKTRRQNVWTSEQFHEEQRKLKHHMTAYDPLWDSFSAKSDIRAMQRTLEVLPDQMRLFHHHKLVADPEQGAHVICDFLKLGFDEAMLQVQRRSSAKWDAKKKHVDAIPRYRRMLHPAEIALSQSVLHKELTWLEYPLDKIRFGTRCLMPFLLVRSGFDLLLRIYRRWSYKGTGYIFDMFKMYLRRFGSIWKS